MPQAPSSGPSFLRQSEKLEIARRKRVERERRREVHDSQVATRSRKTKAKRVPDDFVLGASPWIDFTLTSFWLDNRVDNFLNLGMQVGGYFAERLRVSVRLVAPVEEATDQYDSYDRSYNPDGPFDLNESPSASLLYSASLGLVLSNSKTFLFAPSVVLLRTDVNDYGTAAQLSLPFEWTTARHLRVGFELALGHAFGGSVSRHCRRFAATASASCGDDDNDSIDRPGGTALILQYQMGWALSAL